MLQLVWMNDMDLNTNLCLLSYLYTHKTKKSDGKKLGADFPSRLILWGGLRNSAQLFPNVI